MKPQLEPVADCPDCGGVGFFRQDVPVNDPNFGKPIKCTNPVHVTKTVGQLSGLSQLHRDDLRIRLSDIAPIDGNENMLEMCHRMLKHPFGWLYIWGPYGNAKTVALKAMCNHFSMAGYRPVVYIKFSKLADIVRAAQAAQFAKGKYLQKHGSMELWDNGPIDTYERLLGIKVLAIEEFDKARLTPLIEEFRFDFLDDRYEQALRGETITMFVSQSPPDELPGALASRVNDGRFLVSYNEANDTRPTKKRRDNDLCLPV